jgi:hypothetical protein
MDTGYWDTTRKKKSRFTPKPGKGRRAALTVERAGCTVRADIGEGLGIWIALELRASF